MCVAANLSMNILEVIPRVQAPAHVLVSDTLRCGVQVLMDILGVAISCKVSTFVLEQLATGLELPGAALS